MKESRWTNYGLWLSIFAFIPLLLEGFGLKVLPENYNEIVTAFLSILVMAGLISNPTTTNKWFNDDNKEKKINKPQQ